jgi:hypothetical protein
MTGFSEFGIIGGISGFPDLTIFRGGGSSYFFHPAEKTEKTMQTAANSKLNK